MAEFEGASITKTGLNEDEVFPQKKWLNFEFTGAKNLGEKFRRIRTRVRHLYRPHWKTLFMEATRIMKSKPYWRR